MIKVPRLVFLTIIGGAILFALLPANQQTDVLSWLVIAFVSISTIYLAIAWRQHLGRWHGWFAVVIGLFISLNWLRVQWFAASPIVQQINIVVALWAWALFIAVFISSGLMLIYRGASVVFMGLAWLGLPIILLAMGATYGTTAVMDNAPLNGKLLLGVPILWVICVGGISLPIFLLQLLLLVRKEFMAH